MSKKRELRTVDPKKLQRIYHRCTSCGFEDADMSYFGKIQIPTPAEESAPGISDPFIFLCSNCFNEASVDVRKHNLRIILTPTKQIPIVEKKEKVVKTVKQEVKERVQQLKKKSGGLFS